MLTNKQKSYLRSLANQKKSLVQIGKDGISYSLVQSLEVSLEAHELVKVNLLKTAPITAQHAAVELAAQTKSEIIQIIGKTIIFYRKNPDGKIELPK